MTQDEALDILKMGYSVFLTGEAGTGKTYVLNAFVEWLREHDIEPAVTASTGIAATHIGGSTIHSWSGIGVRDKITSFELDAMGQRKNLWQRLDRTRILIIDEISMLSGGFLDMSDMVSRHMKRNDEPFGGMQVVFSGDFFQLPPVARDGANSAYAFDSRVWRESSPVTCYLEKQYRQEDGVFYSLLSSIRRREITDGIFRLLESRKDANIGKKRITRLFTHNIDVDSRNAAELARLSGKTEIFYMQTKGRKQYVESLMRGCLAPEVLRLKKGAEVMFVKNDQSGHYANGTQGAVVGFEKGIPAVKTRAGRVIFAAPQSWTREEDGRILAEISQVPLRLAWAITVHKSQGMTLDEAEMDLGNSFVPGQGYVALSRVRGLEGLYLRNFNEIALSVDEHVASQDKNFKAHSRLAAERLSRLGQDAIKERQAGFILSCGGSVEPLSADAMEDKKPKERVPTREQTRRLFEKGFTIKQAASERNLAISTIIGHAEDLVKEGAKVDFSYLAPSPKIKAAVSKAVVKKGFDYLFPVKARLEKRGFKISYDKLRLIRLYMMARKNMKS